MNDKRINQYLVLPDNGQRKDTKLAVEYDEEKIADYLKQGYVIVNQADFNKLIGNGDGEYLIADDGSVYPKPAPTDVELLAVAKPAKISELKAARDAKEMEPVLYAKHKFDFDSKSYERITAAIYALDLKGATSTINWTLADNGSTPVTANDLRGVIAAAAVRSDALHTAYRALKSQVQAAETVADVATIVWPED